MMKVSWARDNYWKKRNCVYYEKQLSQSRRKALWGIGAGKTAEHDRVGLSPHTTCLSPDRLATCLLAAAHKAQVSGGNLIRLNLPSRTGLGRTTLSWPIPMAQFQGPFHISRPVTDTLHVSVPTSLFVRFGCYHQVPETGWFKQKTRISHSSGGWEAQDPGAS
ncbi:uncharacterized protein LOC144311141 isoform X2 [Canis aureus]